MKVLSLFDGMSCGQIAFERAGILVEKYYASEIDKYAIKITQSNYPDTIQLGSITDWQSWNIEKPDIIIAGSPCQGFSFAGKQLNFNDPRSALFFTFVDILKHYKPKYFLLENVIMKKEYNDVISGILGEIYPECVSQTELFRTGRLEPICINSALLSAQNRRRLYWTNIHGIEQPKDKGILLKDIIENAETEKEKSYCILSRYNNSSAKGAQKRYLTRGADQLVKCGAFRGRNPENPTSRESGLDTVQMLEIRDDEKTNTLTSVEKDNVLIIAGYADIKGNESIKRVYSPKGKAPTLTAVQGGNQEPKIAIRENFYKNRAERIFENKSPTIRSGRSGLDVNDDNITWRKLTVTECERLQTVPDKYCKSVSNSRAYHALGNGWTVDVIAHIFSFIKTSETDSQNNKRSSCQ